MHGPSVAAALIVALIAVAPTGVLAQDSDSVLTAKVKIALFADARIMGRLLAVEVDKGVVVLRGEIGSSESSARASSLVEGLPGVKRVRNDLRVRSFGERPPIAAADGDITRRVHARLLEEGPTSRVDVRTDGGTVILTGAVATIDVSARASELARAVPGVVAVTNELTHAPAIHPAGKAAPRPAAPR